ncbi:MAG: peptidylprolyl isomerase [Patescibacteria group bacterium]
MKTSHGDIMLELFAKDAPRTLENFVKLSREGFYDGTKFHRVIKGFMIQGGDPNSKDDDWSDDGTGGPGYQFEDEINARKIVRGALAMANAGPGTNGSQFFIVTADAAPWLDGKHTVFGRVAAGMDVVDKIENVRTDKAKGDHPIENVTVTAVEILKQ